MLDIKIERTNAPKSLPDKDDPLSFGKIFTDHMFVMEYQTDKGWYDPKIIPYQPICLEPSAMVFHYGQEMFEGLKAYKAKDGRILLFRPDMNAKRTNRTNKRLCMPEIPEEDFIQAIKELVKMDKAWIPTKEGTSLYIRPFVIATSPFLGVYMLSEVEQVADEIAIISNGIIGYSGEISKEVNLEKQFMSVVERNKGEIHD